MSGLDVACGGKFDCLDVMDGDLLQAVVPVKTTPDKSLALRHTQSNDYNFGARGNDNIVCFSRYIYLFLSPPVLHDGT